MSKVIVFSVVRDFAMYERCVRGNPNCAECDFAPYDNRGANDYVSVGYNRLLEVRPAEEDAWYVFCHEDFELREPIASRLNGLDCEALWGPIGAATEPRLGVYWQWQLRGQVEECKKDGTGARKVGAPVPQGTEVDTFDCQCLIVHSTLVRRLNLRFDEHLSFDLYVEDFCIAAREAGDVRSRILPLSACHWSGGCVQQRYYEQEAYLNAKYPNACYTGTSSWTIGGKIPFFWRLTVAIKHMMRRLCAWRNVREHSSRTSNCCCASGEQGGGG